MNEKLIKMEALLVEARGFTASPTAIENIDIVISMIERMKPMVKNYVEERV